MIMLVFIKRYYHILSLVEKIQNTPLLRFTLLAPDNLVSCSINRLKTVFAGRTA